MLGSRLKEHTITKGDIPSIAEHLKDSGHRVKTDRGIILQK